MILSPIVAREYVHKNNTFSCGVADELALPLALEIGDSKQPGFIPQVKLMKWDNEVNFSMRLTADDYAAGIVSTVEDRIEWEKDGNTVSFYSKPKLEPVIVPDPSTLLYRYIETEDYNEANVFHDLSDVYGAGELRMLAVCTTVPTICLNGFYSKGKYLDLTKVPGSMQWARKFTMREAGAVVYDKGNIDFNIIGATYVTDDMFINAIVNALQALGVDAYRSQHREDSNDIVFMGADGMERKVCGTMREFDDAFDFVINVSTDFSQYDFYKGDTSTRTSVAGSLNEVIPDVTNEQVVAAVAKALSDVTGFPASADSYNEDEQAFLDVDKALYALTEWIEDANPDNFDLPRGLIQDKHDGYEFDVLVTRPLVSNVIPFSVQSKGVALHYQPRLSQEEIDQGRYRSIDVIGSYAIYHLTERDDKSAIGGRHYSTGKVGHIFRPKITDAQGAFAWGDLSYDEDGSVMNLIIPQQFLDTAVYPLLIDPTFGYTTQGTSATSFTIGDVRAWLPTTGAAGTGTSISFASTTGSVSNKQQAAVYDGATGNLLTNGTSVTLNGTTSLGFHAVAFNASPTLTAVSYFLVFEGHFVSKQTGQIQFDTISTTGSHDTSTYVDQSWPSTLTFASGSESFSIFVTYSTGVAAVPYVPTLPFLGAG